jgi:predicted nucleic acid-binding Zn ribbon protein
MTRIEIIRRRNKRERNKRVMTYVIFTILPLLSSFLVG